MNAYQIILDKGQLGALKYANEIDNINPKLASEIDAAILDIETTAIKISKSFAFVKQAQSAQQYQQFLKDLPTQDYTSSPEDIIEESTESESPKEEKPLDELEIPDSIFQAGAGAINLFIAKYLATAGLKQTAINKLLEKANKFGFSNYVLNEIYTKHPELKGRFGDVDQTLLQSEIAKKGFNIQKSFKGIKVPAANTQDFSNLQDAVERWLGEADAAGVKNVALKSLKDQNSALYAALEKPLNLPKTIAISQAEDAIAKSIKNPAVNKIVDEIIEGVANRFPGILKIGGFTKFVGRFMPLIGAAFEAAGIIQMYQKEGITARLCCHVFRALIFTLGTTGSAGAAVGSGGTLALPAAAVAVLTIGLNFLMGIACDTFKQEEKTNKPMVNQ